MDTEDKWCPVGISQKEGSYFVRVLAGLNIFAPVYICHYLAYQKSYFPRQAKFWIAGVAPL